MNFMAILLLVICWIYTCPVAVVGVKFCISNFCGSVFEVYRSKTLTEPFAQRSFVRMSCIYKDWLLQVLQEE
jgi:hypothetical protein